MTFSKFVEDCKSLVPEYADKLIIPKDEADLCLPCFFAPEPEEFAKSLEEKLKPAGLVKEIKAVGPYLNFYVDVEALSRETVKEILEKGKSYGSKKCDKTVIIDYSSPNVAKPMSVGHMRSTIIGDSLRRIYTHLGWNVIADNHIGDWGTQFGKLISGFYRWSSMEKLRKDPIGELFRIYVKFHEEAEKNPDLNEEAREYFKRLEQGDDELRKLWETFVSLSIKEFKKVYEILDVKFDYYLGESFYVEMAKKILEELKTRGISKTNEDGSVYVDLKKFGLPDLIILKSNESTLYQTRDLAAIKYREEKFKPDKILYVVGMEQSLYFKQLFKVAELLGFDSSKYEHVGFGLVVTKEGKMSTRRGRVVFLKDLLKKAIDLAKEIMKGREIEDLDETSRIVGVGAIKFADLKQNRTKDVVFDWDKMMSLEGDSGPYVQYTAVRIKSILRKSSLSPELGFVPQTETEKKIVKLISKFPDVVLKSQEENKPNYIANYLIDLCSAFNKFYHETKIIGSDDEEKKLGFVKSVGIVIETGLYLLGIGVPDKM